MKRWLCILSALVLASGLLSACGGVASSAPSSESVQSVSSAAASSEPGEEHNPVTLLVAAAASLEYSYTEELIPLFEAQYPWVTVEGTYDSSGKLQTQIEEGLAADVFMSAATKQMTALSEAGLIDAGSVVDLLENKIVLVAPAGSDIGITSFAEILKADTIAIGDPESVPAGQYAKEALETLGLWEEMNASKEVSLGTNVTEVLNWVAEGSADVGIVYATDAAATEDVQVLAEAPEGALASPVLYPVGIVAASANREAAERFVAFLQSPEALAVFQRYGFTPNV